MALSTLHNRPSVTAEPAQSDRSASSLSVVVVSDFESGEKTWKDEIAMAGALAHQDIDIDFDLIIVENGAHHNKPPPKIIGDTFPGAKIVYYDSEKSAALKDYGVSLCDTEWVAILEADALPEPDWLRRLIQAATKNPEYDVFSGRTDYGADSSWKRALNLLDRSFDDKGYSGSTTNISNNGALYRTEMIKKFPYPDAATPFLSSRLRNRMILQAGHKAYFERKALMRHRVGGLRFVMDFRRNTGFADMMVGGSPRVSKIPSLLRQRARAELRKIWRLHAEYWRWYDWPLGLLLFCFARIPESMGMVAALNNKDDLRGSAYR